MRSDPDRMTAREVQAEAARRMLDPADWNLDRWEAMVAAVPTRTDELQQGMFVFDIRSFSNVREFHVEAISRRGVWLVTLRWTWGGLSPQTVRSCASADEWLVTPQPSYWRPMSPEDQAAHDAWTREARARIRADHVNRGYQTSR